ncbi:hypothetical protein ACJDT4_19600 [Clostridium neuense]|uniref:Uncharacterized protein n=1 Tax=Clostridium neuense TaxID=1728934 RepID=A0ABW8TM85_9CLOT
MLKYIEASKSFKDIPFLLMQCWKLCNNTDTKQFRSDYISSLNNYINGFDGNIIDSKI